MPSVEKIVLITRKTPLEELAERYGTVGQARFYLEHMGLSFASYATEHAAYESALERVRGALPRSLPHQVLAREYLPNYLFGERDLVLVLGPDGLVVNAAKYLSGQPVLAVNPDPTRIDGVLLPFACGQIERALGQALTGALPSRAISMAEARLNDGRTLRALNDLFIGHRSHVSARYHLRHGERAEDQSSSGVIISTGAGSTGWYRSVLAGAAGVAEAILGLDAGALRAAYRLDWESDQLLFSVREPFESRASQAGLVAGRIEPGEALELTSRMPQGGVIFGDGVEADYLTFHSGSIARIGLAEQRVRLLVPA